MDLCAAGIGSLAELLKDLFGGARLLTRDDRNVADLKALWWRDNQRGVDLGKFAERGGRYSRSLFQARCSFSTRACLASRSASVISALSSAGWSAKRYQ